MKKIILGSVLLMIAAMPAMAQKASKTLKKVLELKMPKTVDDDMPGTRGASVAWHPIQKKYYAAFAGNARFPMAVFDAAGKRLSGENDTAMIDTRGLWYNPATKLISGNAYSEYGWFTYKLNAKGMVTDYVITKEGMNQPTEQCVGAYNPALKYTYFLKGSTLYTFDKDAASLTTITIRFGRKQSEGPSDDEDVEVTPEEYNYTTPVYTGVKGQEIGFLNATMKQVELYNIKTGYKTATIALPDDATAETSFNFAYTNGIYWLFDIENRVWKGYK